MAASAPIVSVAGALMAWAVTSAAARRRRWPSAVCCRPLRGDAGSRRRELRATAAANAPHSGRAVTAELGRVGAARMPADRRAVVGCLPPGDGRRGDPGCEDLPIVGCERWRSRRCGGARAGAVFQAGVVLGRGPRVLTLNWGRRWRWHVRSRRSWASCASTAARTPPPQVQLQRPLRSAERSSARVVRDSDGVAAGAWLLHVGGARPRAAVDRPGRALDRRRDPRRPRRPPLRLPRRPRQWAGVGMTAGGLLAARPHAAGARRHRRRVRGARADRVRGRHARARRRC